MIQRYQVTTIRNGIKTETEVCDPGDVTALESALAAKDAELVIVRRALDIASELAAPNHPTFYRCQHCRKFRGIGKLCPMDETDCAALIKELALYEAGKEQEEANER